MSMLNFQERMVVAGKEVFSGSPAFQFWSFSFLGSKFHPVRRIETSDAENHLRQRRTYLGVDVCILGSQIGLLASLVVANNCSRPQRYNFDR